MDHCDCRKLPAFPCLTSANMWTRQVSSCAVYCIPYWYHLWQSRWLDLASCNFSCRCKCQALTKKGAKLKAKAPEKPEDGNSRAQQAMGAMGHQVRSGWCWLHGGACDDMHVLTSHIWTLVPGVRDFGWWAQPEIEATLRVDGKRPGMDHWRAGGGRDQGLQWLQPLAQEAIKSGSKERILSAAREVLMESWYRMVLMNFPHSASTQTVGVKAGVEAWWVDIALLLVPKQVHAAAVPIVSKLICYSSIATVACICYIGFLSPTLFGGSCRCNSIVFWCMFLGLCYIKIHQQPFVCWWCIKTHQVLILLQDHPSPPDNRTLLYMCVCVWLCMYMIHLILLDEMISSAYFSWKDSWKNANNSSAPRTLWTRSEATPSQIIPFLTIMEGASRRSCTACRVDWATHAAATRGIRCMQHLRNTMCSIQHECSCIVATLCEEYFEDMKALGILEPDVVTLGSS